MSNSPKNAKKLLFVLIILTNIFLCASGDNQSEIFKNITCQKHEESEFPEDVFTKKQRKYGAIILHVILFLYCFGAIAIVCSEYFLPTIKRICEDLKLSDDVAAATFMSIATSSPELFTNIIGTFITESDIGFGHVVGNAYFDMFFVAALGGFAAKQDIILDWWPLARDCSIYFVVALTLTGIVWDGVVQTHETIILLLLYIIYFSIMFNNKKIIKLISSKYGIEINNAESNDVIPAPSVENDKFRDKEKMTREEIEPLDCEQNFTLTPAPIQSLPKKKNKCWSVTKKVLTMPLEILIRYTIPDVRINKLRNYYPLAFVLCVAWIGISTYLGTWMISVIGDTIGVPDLVMGMVFMAAGGSVVEAYSVYYKAKRGECSIGLSNSMGCNNLDATMCLALPWFIKTLIPIKSAECKNHTSNIILGSSLLHINCILLVISVTLLFSILYINKFKLNKRLGLICGSLYALVLTIAISIENYSNEL